LLILSFRVPYAPRERQQLSHSNGKSEDLQNSSCRLALIFGSAIMVPGRVRKPTSGEQLITAL